MCYAQGVRPDGATIGIMGAGAVGCYLGGRLAALGENVLFVGRAHAVEELARSGLTLHDLGDGIPVVVPPEAIRATTDASALADRDIVLVCVKSGQSSELGAELSPILRAGTIVVSMQNGVRNADTLREHLPQCTVLGGIVGFNVVYAGASGFRRATTGPLVIEARDDLRVAALARTLVRAGLETELARDIRAKQWSKLVVNLNNAVSALTDAPTPRLIFEKPYRGILRAIMAEALAILRTAGVRPARIGPLPVAVFPFILSLPTPILRMVARVQLEVDPQARSSMWEDLVRGRPTEVEYLNGEIVRLARSAGASAPLNERIVALIHDAESAGRGSPKLGAAELWRALTT